MIELSDVDVILSPDFAVRDVSLTIEKNQYAVLMGQTGCGKSTLLETICGLRPISSGRIVIDGRDVTRLRPAERLVGYVPQDLALFQRMSVADHLRMGPRLRRWPKKQVESRVTQLLGDLKIDHLRDRRPRGLSGGEQQRVALGRALAAEPPVLLLDEPLSALDEETRDNMLQLLEQVQASNDITIIHVTHSSSEAKRLGDVVHRMAHGRLANDG